MSAATEPPIPPVPLMAIAEVRYSLPQLLEELKVERATSTLAMEKLDQQEIGRLFKTKARRAKPRK